MLRLVKNYSNVWVRVKVVPETESNMSERKIILTLTDDHPLPVQGGSPVYAESRAGRPSHIRVWGKRCASRALLPRAGRPRIDPHNRHGLL